MKNKFFKSSGKRILSPVLLLSAFDVGNLHVVRVVGIHVSGTVYGAFTNLRGLLNSKMFFFNLNLIIP